jgi:hypothetical protein
MLSKRLSPLFAVDVMVVSFSSRPDFFTVSFSFVVTVKKSQTEEGEGEHHAKNQP